MLIHVKQSLRPGGRLVIVDRAQNDADSEQVHEVPLARVEEEIRQKGFEIVHEDNRFIDRPGDIWWMAIARTP